VTVNFERDDLGAALTRAGHDSAESTCWIWEGVVMYLTPETMRATLAQVASSSAEGSRLIVNYHTSRRARFVRLFLRLIGEPLKGHWSPAEMAAELGAAGFEVREDSNIVDWAARFATGTVQTRHGMHMRVAVAERDV
jgi:methyltransferase (TIGR00027 family)